MPSSLLRVTVALLVAAGGLLGPRALASPGIAMHGAPKEAGEFRNFSYVNPEAPKGGRLTLGAFGSFDSVNPLIVRGEPVQGVREYVIESLMARSQDEAFTLYPLIAESIEVSPDRRRVTFRVDPRAKFSDGKPITADDVLFSFELLRDKARPNYRTYYRKVAKTERVSDREVAFELADDKDRELPMILALMPVLAKHAVNPETFEATTLSPMLGSGAYVMASIDPGRGIVYRRNPDWWGADLPVNRGRFNFDEIRFEYYREASTQFEAFKTGEIDLRTEDDPALWAGGYTFPAIRDGRAVKEEIATGLPAGMTGLAFNTRRPQFQDARVREALTLLFNFEWINATLFHGLYRRTQSYFERSELSSNGKPADARERELLAPFADRVRPAIMDGTFSQPASDGSGHNRTNARAALALLDAAGYALKDGKLVSKATGAPFVFEILSASAGQERLLGAFAADLERVGISARLRVVDSSQYQSRLKDYDFDMILFTWPASLSPGNEQLFRWSAAVGKQAGSFNYPGVDNPAVDAMIAALLAAESNEDFTSAVRALDRVLLSGNYVIPLFHVPKPWVAYWQRLKHPDTLPLLGFNLDSWWIEPGK